MKIIITTFLTLLSISTFAVERECVAKNIEEVTQNASKIIKEMSIELNKTKVKFTIDKSGNEVVIFDDYDKYDCSKWNKQDMGTVDLMHYYTKIITDVTDDDFVLVQATKYKKWLSKNDVSLNLVCGGNQFGFIFDKKFKKVTLLIFTTMPLVTFDCH